MKPRWDFFEHLFLEIEIHGRMLLASPARRKEILRPLRMLRSSRKLDRYSLKRYREKASLQAVLERRPLSAFPRVRDAIWRHYGLFAPGLKPDPRPSTRPARKAYDLARRNKPDAALRELDALIARLSSGSLDGLSPAEQSQLLTDAYLFAGAVGYMVCDETAGAYYALACELASYKVPALLVLGAIFVRLGRIDEARTAWGRALRIEQDEFARLERGPHTLGQWESLQDDKVKLQKLEDMVASLDKRPEREPA